MSCVNRKGTEAKAYAFSPAKTQGLSNADDPPYLMMMAMKPEDLLIPRREGLYCPPGDFFIDPVRNVDRAWSA